VKEIKLQLQPCILPFPGGQHPLKTLSGLDKATSHASTPNNHEWFQKPTSGRKHIGFKLKRNVR
jgi:hypothetical protein